VLPGEVERWAAENDPIDRYVARLTAEGVKQVELDDIHERIRKEIDEATDVAEQSGSPEAIDALNGIYADPPAERPLWFREGKGAVVEKSERPSSWGTFDAPAKGAD
jgi:TPP-dependent pyruvate/acetoin dehydrogenase alpha subunit